MLGPKLREWPSLRRLLEVGVTISGTGRRETGLERSEYDQGQHDDVRTVLAVNTAGMLVRRSVLEELGGFDEQLAVFGNDIDFGWRAAAAGHKTVVVPSAVVFHVEAAHRGVRRTPLTGRHTHYQERRAAMYTLLANARGWALPWKVVRLLFGTLLRVLGFLLVRSVGQAFDELAALVSLYGSPGQIRAARRERKSRRPAHEHDVRGLLAPWWLPYRHGLDVVSDLATALTLQAQDVAERRRAAAAAAEGDHPVTPRRTTTVDEDEGPAADTGLVARFLTNPVALGLAVFVLLVLFGAREGIGPVSGGGLSAAPGRRRLPVAAADRLVARPGAGHGRARAAVRAAARDAGDPARRQRLRGRVGGPAARRPGRALGRVAVPEGRRPPQRRRRRTPLAAGRGLLHVRAGPRHQRRVGRRPAGDRRRDGRPAVAGARGPGLRRPRARPPVAGSLALRSAARPGRRLHPGRLVLRRGADRRPSSASAS